MAASAQQRASSSAAEPTRRRRAEWLSQGLEALFVAVARRRLAIERRRLAAQPDFDVIIVGSGYGAAIAAAELSATRDSDTGKRTRVCVLERGREYLPGAFPTRLADLGGHVRYSHKSVHPKGQRSGLFDVRPGPDLSVLVASGLGGGSLINAGVMEAPKLEVFAGESWPAAIRAEASADSTEKSLAKWLTRAGQRLGALKPVATGMWKDNVWADDDLPKFAAMRRWGGRSFVAPKITVAVDGEADPHSSANVRMSPCIRCGDCMTGCNFEAKESLDVGVLVSAKAMGAELYCGATVLRIDPDEALGWRVGVNHTDEKLRRRQSKPLELTARRVVLAAGTLGSTEILLRSRRERAFPLSERLGSALSANGDMIVAAVALSDRVNDIGDETVAFTDRDVGPTITAMIDERSGRHGMVVQELSVPSPLRRLAQETTAAADAFRVLADGDESTHRRDSDDPCAADALNAERTLVFAVMGEDSADGRIELLGDSAEPGRSSQGDGAVRVVWPHLKDDARLGAREKRLDALRRRARAGGRLLSNPSWRVLPAQLEFLFGKERGPLVTVHPLGGCPMGDDVSRGVVDHLGRVFRGLQPAPSDDEGDNRGPQPAPGETYGGLVVLDGSIVPCSLGINPALTIAALALRAVDGLIEPWGLERRSARPLKPRRRPYFRAIDSSQAPTAGPETEVQLIERLSGPVRIGSRRMFAELTLEFQPRAVAKLISKHASERWLDIDRSGSRLRLFSNEAWQKYLSRPSREPRDEEAAAVIPIESGRLTLFRRKASAPCERRLASLSPWFNNRGWRDLAQEAIVRLGGREPKTSDEGGLLKLVVDRATSTWNLLSLAGETRLLEYEIQLGAVPQSTTVVSADFGEQTIRAVKTLTYSRRGNPWRQLMEASFVDAPFKARGGGPAVLELDTQYLARREVPLIRIVRQANQPMALVDLASFALYALRILVRIHTWTFRKPDQPRAREVCRLPGDVPGLGRPEIKEIVVGREDGVAGRAVNIRLSRYPHPDRAARPVLMIHGYSASGTTFAHHATPSLARELHRNGFEPWLVDLRTSAGMPTARDPWSFEVVANCDIPVAIDHVWQATGGKPIDVVAHCMGSAMLQMALLGDLPKGPVLVEDPEDPYRSNLRAALPSRIRSLVMSQVAPLTMFSRANVLRAFLMRYLRQFLDVESYQFRVEEQPDLAGQMLDRFLASMPYPVEEFDVENPPFLRGLYTPWTGTRHRMDALYGRDFSVRNMSPRMLDYIDDHFGPLSIETVSQAIHFARFGQLADKDGNTRFATPQRVLARLLNLPMLSIHGEDNGLADKSTLDYMTRLNESLGGVLDYQTRCIPGCGHQDSLIGTTAERDVFPEIIAFLKDH